MAASAEQVLKAELHGSRRYAAGATLTMIAVASSSNRSRRVNAHTALAGWDEHRMRVAAQHLCRTVTEHIW
jgi:hypothetical protein